MGFEPTASAVDTTTRSRMLVAQVFKTTAGTMLKNLQWLIRSKFLMVLDDVPFSCNEKSGCWKYKSLLEVGF